MAEATILLSGESLEKLRLSRWNRLPDDERQRLVAQVAEALAAAGHSFSEPEIQSHGPTGEQPLLELGDARSGVTFVLVPGGSLAPGYDEEELAAYARVHQRLFGWTADRPWTDADCEDDAPEEYEYYDPPERTMVFGAAGTCDLRLRPPVRVEPFMMAALPVPAGRPGVREGTGRTGEPARVARQRLRAVLKRAGWALPSSPEYEWALRGGERGLFYWGNDLPAFVLEQGALPGIEPTRAELRRAAKEPGVRFEDVMLDRIDGQRPREWPYANRFGLAGTLAWSAWCVAGDPTAPDPRLVTRGGAMECYGWQGCGEWKLLLNAVESGEGALTTPTLRPVIRLCAAE